MFVIEKKKFVPAHKQNGLFVFPSRDFAADGFVEVKVYVVEDTPERTLYSNDVSDALEFDSFDEAISFIEERLVNSVNISVIDTDNL